MKFITRNLILLAFLLVPMCAAAQQINPGRDINWAASSGCGVTGYYNPFTNSCSPASGSMVYPAANTIGVANSGATGWRAPLYSDITHLWASGSCTGFLKSDDTCSATPGIPYPSAGLAKSSGSAWVTPGFADVVALWASGSCTSGYLKYDGSCDTPGGGGGGTQSFVLPNDTSTGTAANLMACWNTGEYEQENVITCPVQSSYGTDNPPWAVGVVTAGAGTSGNATVQYDGVVSWTCDTQVYPGQQVQLSTSVAGECDCPNGTLPGCIAPGEHTFGTSVFGRVITGNTGSGTAAMVQLSPFTTSASGGFANPNLYGAFLMLSMGNGSSFLQQSTVWQQLQSTFAAPFSLLGPGYCFSPSHGSNGPALCISGEGDGPSGLDITVDSQLGGALVDNAQWEWKANQYVTPTDTQSISGTVDVPSGHFGWQPGKSTNMHFWTLSGNATIPFPTNINPGDEQTILLFQSGGSLFTITWSSGFQNCPAAPAALGGYEVVHMIFDGTNEDCF